MVNSPNCALCIDTVETIKHVLWDCPRSTRVWDFLNNETRDFLGTEYISYETIILGNSTPIMAMETLIVWITKMIMAINREELISNEVVDARFKTLFFYEKQTFGLNSKKTNSLSNSLLFFGESLIFCHF